MSEVTPWTEQSQPELHTPAERAADLRRRARELRAQAAALEVAAAAVVMGEETL